MYLCRWLDDRGDAEMVEQEFMLSEVLHGDVEKEDTVIGEYNVLPVSRFTDIIIPLAHEVCQRGI